MAVTNPYYEFTPEFIPGTKARSDEVNLQYQAIQNAFDLLPGDADALTTDTAIFAPESGSGNAYVVTMPDTRTSNQDGDGVRFFATHTNTGAATLDVDGIGPVAFTNWDGDAFVGGEVISGRLYEVRYDATNTRFILAATLDAALQVEWAEEWAQNPEDVPVSSAAGGDGATTFSALHWAAKSLASAAAGRINADIITATPPTTEAVTANLEYWDLDDTDLLLQIGFSGSNTAFITNQMHGGGILISGQNVGGAGRTMLTLDPDTSVTFNHPASNRIAFLSQVDGIAIRGSLNPAIGGVQDTNIIFEDSDGDDIANFGFINGADFRVESLNHGANIVLAAENAAGALQDLLTLDPDALAVSTPAGVQFLLPLENDAATPTLAFGDGDSGFYEASDDTIHTTLQGNARWVFDINFFGTLNTARPALRNITPSAVIPDIIPVQTDSDTGIGSAAVNNLSLIAGGFEMMRLDGTSSFQRVMAQYPLFIAESTPENDLVGYGQFSVNAGTAQFTDASGNDFNFLSTLRLPTTAELRMQAAGSGIVYLYSTGSTDAEARYISLRHADGVSRGYMGHASSLLELRNEIHGGAFRVNCENSSGVLTQMIDAQPDGIFDIRGATSVAITLGASAEFGANFALNGAATLYYDDQGRFYTMTSGSAQIRRATTTDTDQCRLGFANSNGVDRGWVGFGVQGNSRIELNSEVHGGAVYLTGETAGGAAQNLFSGAPGANDTIVYSNGVSELVVGTTKITANTLFLNERSAAIADVAGDGQLWVLNDSPNILMFTDDSGQDYAVAMNGGYVNDNVNVNNSWNFNTTGNRSANFVSYHDDGGNDTITLGNSTGTGLTNFPVYDSITILAPTSGNITITEGTSTTLYDETGTDTVGGVVLSGGAVTIFRASATKYIIWGNGYT
jgi:hypothetical protein